LRGMGYVASGFVVLALMTVMLTKPGAASPRAGR
jgi:hypothetical protein